jgi:hypothetical protein
MIFPDMGNLAHAVFPLVMPTEGQGGADEAKDDLFPPNNPHKNPQKPDSHNNSNSWNARQLEIMNTLFRNAQSLSFGAVSVELKIHAGRCVGIVYTTSENIRHKETGEDLLSKSE